jgi:hypothetical protein
LHSLSRWSGCSRSPPSRAGRCEAVAVELNSLWFGLIAKVPSWLYPR